MKMKFLIISLILAIPGASYAGDLAVNGKVGIGMTAPDSTLQLKVIGGKVSLGNSTESAGNYSVSIGDTGTDYVPSGQNKNYTLMLNASATTSLGFNDAGTNAASIKYSNLLFTVGADDGWGLTNVYMPGRLAVGSTANFSNGRVYITGNGYITGVWTQNSDLRFKEDILPVDSPLLKVLNMRGVSYNYKRSTYPEKDFPEGRHYGVIAQEINTVAPEVVFGDRQTGELSVSYSEIIPILIEAIKEQQMKIRKLEADIVELKRR